METVHFLRYRAAKSMRRSQLVALTAARARWHDTCMASSRHDYCSASPCGVFLACCLPGTTPADNPPSGTIIAYGSNVHNMRQSVSIINRPARFVRRHSGAIAAQSGEPLPSTRGEARSPVVGQLWRASLARFHAIPAANPLHSRDLNVIPSLHNGVTLVVRHSAAPEEHNTGGDKWKRERRFGK